MRKRKSIITFLATGLASALMLSSAYAAVTNPYPQQLQEVLTQYNIDQDNIRSQKTLERRTPDDDNQRVRGYDTYIHFKDCKGYLQVFQHRFGRVDQVYTRGECQIPGIKNF